MSDDLTDELGTNIPLSEMLQTLRTELQVAMRAGEGQPVRFDVGPVDLELQVRVAQVRLEPRAPALRIGQQPVESTVDTDLEHRGLVTARHDPSPVVRVVDHTVAMGPVEAIRGRPECAFVHTREVHRDLANDRTVAGQLEVELICESRDQWVEEVTVVRKSMMLLREHVCHGEVEATVGRAGWEQGHLVVGEDPPRPSKVRARGTATDRAREADDSVFLLGKVQEGYLGAGRIGMVC